MDFPPNAEDWPVFASEDFDEAEVRNPRNLGMELMVQLRDNGRAQDHFRIALGGGEILTAEIDLSSLFNNNQLNKYKLQLQVWPRDIVIRRNSTTSAWKDVYNLLAERNASVLDETGTSVSQTEVIEVLDSIEDPMKKAAAIRWGVVVGDEKKMQLMLMALPTTEAAIQGRPTLKR